MEVLVRTGIRIGTLPNGLRFYIGDPRNVCWVSGIGVKCGSAHAPPNKVELPHFVEHVISRHSKDLELKECDHIYEGLLGAFGDYYADHNVNTNQLYTFFGHNDIREEAHMLQCFRMFASMLKNFLIEEEDVEVERAALCQDYLHNRYDVVGTVVYDNVYTLLYEKNPIRRHSLFDRESLLSITREELLGFARDFYVPSNAFVVMMGPKFVEAEKIIEASLGDWEDHSVPPLAYDNSDNFPVLRAVRSREIVRPGLGQYHIAVAFPVNPSRPEDFEALEVLGQMLCFWAYKRLRDENSEPGKGVYAVEFRMDWTSLHSLIYFTCATESREFVKVVEAVILDEARKLKANLVSSYDLEPILKRMLGKHFDDISSPDRLANLVVEAVADGDAELRWFESTEARIRGLNRQKLLDVANRYFTEGYARVVVGPEELKF